MSALSQLFEQIEATKGDVDGSLRSRIIQEFANIRESSGRATDLFSKIHSFMDVFKSRGMFPDVSNEWDDLANNTHGTSAMITNGALVELRWSLKNFIKKFLESGAIDDDDEDEVFIRPFKLQEYRNSLENSLKSSMTRENLVYRLRENYNECTTTLHKVYGRLGEEIDSISRHLRDVRDTIQGLSNKRDDLVGRFMGTVIYESELDSISSQVNAMSRQVDNELVPKLARFEEDKLQVERFLQELEHNNPYLDNLERALLGIRAIWGKLSDASDSLARYKEPDFYNMKANNLRPTFEALEQALTF